MSLGHPLATEEHKCRFVAYWLAEVLPDAGISQVVREGYERMVRLYTTPLIGRVRLDQLSVQHVRRMLSSLDEQGCQPVLAAKRDRCGDEHSRPPR